MSVTAPTDSLAGRRDVSTETTGGGSALSTLADTETSYPAPADPAHHRHPGEVTVGPGTGDALQPGWRPLRHHQAAVRAESQLSVALSVPAPLSPRLSTISSPLHLQHRVVVCEILGSPEQHLHRLVVNILHPPLLQHPQVHLPLRHVSLQETLTSTVLIVL